MKFKVFNDNDFEIAEFEQEEMPVIQASTNGWLGICFDKDQSWYNLNFHSFTLVKE